jgi:hypothetical protein
MYNMWISQRIVLIDKSSVLNEKRSTKMIENESMINGEGNGHLLIDRGRECGELIERGSSVPITRGCSELIDRECSELIESGMTVQINRGYSELIGRGCSELIGRGCSELIGRGCSKLIGRGCIACAQMSAQE